MKKIYFSMLVFLTAGLAYGQLQKPTDNKQYTLNKQEVFYVEGKSKGFFINEKAGGDVLINETFSSMGAWTSTGVDAAIWMHDTDGPNGQYSDPATQKISSTTASDGFMIFDADFSNPAAPFENRVGSLVSPIYDLTLTPNVLITFEQSYRHCCSRDFILTMDVTDDNFNTFKTYNISVAGVGVNDQTGTVKTMVNINDFLVSAVALTNVQVRFNFDGSVGTSHYFWQIDDFQVIEQHAYDLSITNAWIGDIRADFEVTEIPAFFAKDIVMQAAVRNFGSTIPTNVALVVDVRDATNTSVFTSQGGTLSNNLNMAYDTILFTTGLNTSALSPGTYTVDMTITFTEADGNTANNTFSRTLMITETKLSSINYDGNVSQKNIAYSYRNTTTGVVPYMRIGTLFSIPSTVSPLFLSGVDLGFSTGPSTAPSTVGEKIYISIYEYDFNATAFNDAFIQYSDEYEYTITPAMLNTTGATYTFNFSAAENGITSSVVLEPGKSYVATFIHYGGDAKYLWYWASQLDEDNSSYTYGPFGVASAESWFTLGNDPVMRMNFEPTTPIISSSDPDNVACVGSQIILTSSTTAQWNLNGTPVTSVNSIIFPATQSGDYTASANGQISNSITLTFNDCTGISDIEATNISIYPNPTRSTLNISNLISSNTIELTDQLGRTLLSWKVNQDQMNLDISKIAPGNYNLVFKGEETILVKQIQIVR